MLSQGQQFYKVILQHDKMVNHYKKKLCIVTDLTTDLKIENVN